MVYLSELKKDKDYSFLMADTQKELTIIINRYNIKSDAIKDFTTHKVVKINNSIRHTIISECQKIKICKDDYFAEIRKSF